MYTLSSSPTSAAQMAIPVGVTTRIALIYNATDKKLMADIYENGSWRGRKDIASW